METIEYQVMGSGLIREIPTREEEVSEEDRQDSYIDRSCLCDFCFLQEFGECKLEGDRMSWMIELEDNNGNIQKSMSKLCNFREMTSSASSIVSGNKYICKCPGHRDYRAACDERNKNNETIYGKCNKELCPIKPDKEE